MPYLDSHIVFESFGKKKNGLQPISYSDPVLIRTLIPRPRTLIRRRSRPNPHPAKASNCRSSRAAAEPSRLHARQIQEACAMYKGADPHNRSFVLLHCWNMLRHTQKWLALPCNNKRQKTSSNASPRSCTPGTNESHHADEEEGPCHTSPSKGRPDGKKKEKARKGKNPISNAETLYMEAMENLWAKKEKAEELKEIRKKERNDQRLAVETRRLELKHEVENRKLELKQATENRRLATENRRLDLQQQELALKER